MSVVAVAMTVVVAVAVAVAVATAVITPSPSQDPSAGAAQPATQPGATQPLGTESTLPMAQSKAPAGDTPTPAGLVSGLIRSPGGQYLYDTAGRVVFFHGVNAVYKLPPYELFPDRGAPWNFSSADASLMARLGFNEVRLGMTWSGLEPGTAPSNDPAICGRGTPGNPHQFNQAVFNRYVHRLEQTVDLLGRFHIYTILDMHQDVYSEMFDGEGAPPWAVCTDGVPSVDPPGRWSLEYSTAAAGIAYRHFWRNDVRGNLQGEYDRMWGMVASAFRSNPWVLGYDPFNEPFSKALVRFHDEHFDAQLECFYTGAAHVGRPSHGAPRFHCPRQTPATGVIPTIVAHDPAHLVFVEPDNYASRGFPTYLGPMNLPHLVYNVHLYCGARSPVTGNPTNVSACADQDLHSLGVRAEDRPGLASPAQHGGPAWFVTEFGATSDPTLLQTVVGALDAQQVGWTYWSWKYYGDPTGSADESLFLADGHLRGTALVLSEVYPQAVAGIPLSYGYSPVTDVFRLSYVPNHRLRAPTVVFVPTRLHYPGGYCATVTGGHVTSPAGADELQIQNAAIGRRVEVVVNPGLCAPAVPRA